MQKKIIALAIAAAFAAPAVALADVTMYGSMDGGFRHQTNDAASAGTTDSMQMGQYNTARFGMKGSDDLGDGMKANVVLETSLAPPGVGSNTAISGPQAVTSDFSSANPFGLLFDRQATIGLSGGWGSFDMGWNYTTSFKVIKSFDPFDYKYLGVAQAKTADYTDRTGNLTYTGKFGDVTVLAEYDVTNATKTTQPSTGAGRAVGVMYASGPINVGASYTAIESSVGSDTPVTHVSLGGGFKFGDGKVSVGYAKKATKTTASDSTQADMWLGASYNVSSKIGATAAYYSRASNTGAAGASDSTSKVAMIGVTYNLSKATQLYLETDKTTTVAAAAGSPDVITTGTSFGLSTSF